MVVDSPSSGASPPARLSLTRHPPAPRIHGRSDPPGAPDMTRPGLPARSSRFPRLQTHTTPPIGGLPRREPPRPLPPWRAAALGFATLALLLPALPARATDLVREFRYPPGRVSLRANRGFSEIAVRGGLDEV